MHFNRLRDPRAFLLVATLLGGCVYDADDRCGPAMRFDSTLNACVCEDNAIPAALGCTACAADEVAVGGACGCPSGQAKNSANVCETVVGLGDACSDAMPCTNPEYGFCAPSTAGTSAATCTSTCTTDADCGASATCATWEAEPYCREYKGIGKSCATQEDCAGTDATACDTVQSHSCIIVGCSLTESNCPRGTQCCDLSAYGAGTMCAENCP